MWWTCFLGFLNQMLNILSLTETYTHKSGQKLAQGLKVLELIFAAHMLSWVTLQYILLLSTGLCAQLYNECATI